MSIPTFVFFGFGMALAAIVLFVSQLFFPYALSSYFFALNGHLKDPDIVVVALDDATINSASFKRYQDISRCDYATLLKNLLNSEPKAIGVDVFFSSASKDAGCDDELSGLLQKNPNIFVGSEYNEKTKEIIPLFNGKKNLETIGLVNIHGYHLAGAFAEEFLGIAHKTDTRNSLLLYSFGKNINVLPISLSLYQYAMGIPSVDISQNEVAFAGKNAFPHSDGRLFINFFSSNYPEISFIDVISNRFDPEFFRGKTVFVGATSHDIHDEFYTPYDTRNFMPGVVIHANAYNSLTAQKPILPIPFWMQMLLWLAFVGIFMAVITVSTSIFRGIAYGIGLLAATIVTAAGLFYFFGIFVEIFPLVTVSIFAGLSAYLWKFVEERQSKNEIRSMFSKYVSSDVADELIRKGIDKLELGGQEREVTLFFSDIVGFTDLSEKLTPADLGKVMNAYFEEMSTIILQRRGTIDKFIGDAVMAFWNAPTEQANHAELACESAVLQRQALAKVHGFVHSIDAGMSIDMRIGIHTWKAVIGNFGCTHRFNYTAFGDSVNLASRLESINKPYGTNIMISESTYRQLPTGKFITRELDMIVVKGRTEPVRIYELMGFGSDSKPDEKEKIDAYAKALALYRNRQFAEAAGIFTTIGDVPSLKFVERCRELERAGVPEDWDGVYRFETK